MGNPPAGELNRLRAQRAAAVRPPLRPRVPLWSGASPIGSVEPDFLHQIELQPLPDGRKKLFKEERDGQPGRHLPGNVTADLYRVAAALPDGLVPVNQDDEVEALTLMDGQEPLAQALQQRGDVSLSSRGRGSGFAGPQAQRPPRGAGSYTQ